MTAEAAAVCEGLPTSCAFEWLLAGVNTRVDGVLRRNQISSDIGYTHARALSVKLSASDDNAPLSRTSYAPTHIME